ncbi:MAG: NUDIX hydrolase, partial [Clostridia bacterium]|nr:NUDIX hydrolase [Clostridia bacterium]
YEATAGGSALKGENEFDCIKRELFEETGIICDDFKEFAYYTFDDDNCLFHCFLCTTDCDKNNIKLQKGETISFKWIGENEFIEFVNSDKMIDTQKRRYINWLKEKGYLR